MGLDWQLAKVFLAFPFVNVAVLSIGSANNFERFLRHKPQHLVAVS